ncbi:hypothetical protein [Levilactobacillus phage ENFP1]|nr:hypothetical protein [Levilactobacillus phage ENFP1]
MKLEKAITYLQGETFKINCVIYSELVGTEVLADYLVIVTNALALLEDLNIDPRLDDINSYNDLYAIVSNVIKNHPNDRIEGIS